MHAEIKSAAMSDVDLIAALAAQLREEFCSPHPCLVVLEVSEGFVTVVTSDRRVEASIDFGCQAFVPEVVSFEPIIPVRFFFMRLIIRPPPAPATSRLISTPGRSARYASVSLAPLATDLMKRRSRTESGDFLPFPSEHSAS